MQLVLRHKINSKRFIIGGRDDNGGEESSDWWRIIICKLFQAAILLIMTEVDKPSEPIQPPPEEKPA